MFAGCEKSRESEASPPRGAVLASTLNRRSESPRCFSVERGVAWFCGARREVDRPFRGAFLARAPRANASGFTLIELLVIIAIVGIVASLAANDLSDLIGRYRLNQAARELAGNVRDCRMMAISDNRECAVRLQAFDSNLTGAWQTNVGRYELQGADMSTGSLQWTTLPDGVVDLANGPGAQVGISIEPWASIAGPPGVSLPDSIVFSPRGFAANVPSDFATGGVIRIVLRNKRSSLVEQRVLRIDTGGNVQIAVP